MSEMVQQKALTALRRVRARYWVHGAILAGLVYMFLVEPHWLAVRRVFIEGLGPIRLVHVTDIHFKGDTAWLARVVRALNAQDVDAVCFTGDLVERAEDLDAALELLSACRHPVYAVPGNHEYWSKSDLDRMAEALRETGGRLLVNDSVSLATGVVVVGLDDGIAGRPNVERAFSGTEGTRRIVLFHEPEWVERLEGNTFALALAGHSHGGQMRLPWLGSPFVPGGTGRYQRGLYRTDAGPLYVSGGVGTYLVPARLFCRPEIVVFTGTE